VIECNLGLPDETLADAMAYAWGATIQLAFRDGHWHLFAIAQGHTFHVEARPVNRGWLYSAMFLLICDAALERLDI
jgi:hypothetical protein